MWFGPLLSLHGVLQRLVGIMSKAGCQPVQQEEPDQDELVGLRNEKAFQREEYARTRKFHKFLLSENVAAKVVATLLFL